MKSHFRGKLTFINQRFADGHSNRIVDLQDFNGSAPDGRFAYQDGTVPPEVIVPPLPARVEKWNHLSSLRIDAGQVRPFMAITFGTTQRQILGLGQTGVLLGNNVVELETPTVLALRELAILTAVRCPDTYELLQLSIHDYSRDGGVRS